MTSVATGDKRFSSRVLPFLLKSRRLGSEPSAKEAQHEAQSWSEQHEVRDGRGSRVLPCPSCTRIGVGTASWISRCNQGILPVHGRAGFFLPDHVADPPRDPRRF